MNLSVRASFGNEALLESSDEPKLSNSRLRSDVGRDEDGSDSRFGDVGLRDRSSYSGGDDGDDGVGSDDLGCNG